ncbi:MAG: C-terminal binding protein [Proteobacteria bacterium]|nr:MAG: C-terminal binding protein [Pseudomonadota bacterium]
MALKVLVADYDFGDTSIEREIVRRAGMAFEAAQCKGERDLIEAARDVDALLVQYAEVRAQAIQALPRLKVIARYGTGVDTVDVDAATAHGIQVTNAPNEWCADEVADHAVALLLALIRKVAVYDQMTREGVWHWRAGRPIHRIAGKVLGLLSFGAISQRVAGRMSAFGAMVCAHDPYQRDEAMRAHGVTPVGFDELLERSDYLVIQAPLTAQTRGLFGERELRRMKPTAFLVNTARGPIIQDRALYRAVREGWIAGAGLDDLEEEPAKQRDWQPDNPLFGMANVLISPHAAYYSEESIALVRNIAAEEAVRVLRGETPRYPVNRVFEQAGG